MTVDADLELMLRVRDGDTESFGVLLHRYRGPLVNYFCRMLHDKSVAEELAQEVFLRVYQTRHRYEPEARFTTWLYRIATNLALNALRDRRRSDAPAEAAGPETEAVKDRIPDPGPSAEQLVFESERERLVRQAVSGLPENQRAAVILHKYQDVDYRQIARILGTSEAAVKSLLFRAYENLRVRLQPLVAGGQL